MRCAMCKNGELEHKTIPMVMERQGVTVVFQHVPALVCDQCGESYLASEVTSHLLDELTKAATCGGKHLDIREFAA
ncbi:MAG: type II toxin-antitoxin system MqsA family antitoxin [Armatimonadota bacterium]